MRKVIAILASILLLSSFSIEDKRSEVQQLRQELELLNSELEALKQNFISTKHQLLDNISFLEKKLGELEYRATYQDKEQSSPTNKYKADPQRCQAITKSGTQCKRMAKPGSDYCWQHQRE